MKKVIKTFTVDEQVYGWLIEKLKEANIGIGVSSLLDGYLKFLYQGLREIFTYIEKNKLNIPASFVVYKYLDDHGLFFQYDWEAIDRKGKHDIYSKELDGEIASYVDELIDEFKKKQKGRWERKGLKTSISRVDRD